LSYRSQFARKLFKEIFTEKKTPEKDKWVEKIEKKRSRVLVQIRGRGICSEKGREALEKELKLPSYSFKYVPFVAVECGGREEEKICSYLKQRLSWAGHISPARVLYIPELIQGGFPVSVKLNSRPGSAWNLNNIGADIANKTTQGKGVKVGIIDTGVDYTHEEVKNRFGGNKGYNFVEDNADPYDGNGHGTHVAGTVAGEETGVAPACSLYAIKVLSDEGYGSEADVLRGIEWAIDNKMEVINMSLGSSQYSYFEDQVIQEAVKRGITVVAAAGNEYYGPSYPAALNNVVAVAAVDRNNEHAEFSNIYETNDISAPGVSIYSSVPGGYQEFSGTSMATPHVTGSLALGKSVKQGSPKELEERLKSSADELGSSLDPENRKKYGVGLVRADKLVSGKASQQEWVQELRLG